METAAVMSPPATLLERCVVFGRDIKLSHSVFAMPFALLAMFLAAAGAGPGPGPGAGAGSQLPGALLIALIVVCMVAARTFAMGVNRLADAALDAHNPRTQKRALPSGRLSRRFMGAMVTLSALVFVAATGVIWALLHNPWPLALSPIALVWLGAYSYTKRFTWLCHLWLGASLALSPIAAAVATHPHSLTRPDVYLLAAMVLCWVAGFDVIYALQDVAVDRAQKLHSMPARLGVEPALWVSRTLHLAAATLLVVLALTAPPLGLGFAVGTGLVAGLLILEHALIAADQEHHLNLAFFTVNGAISLLLGTLGILDVILHRS